MVKRLTDQQARAVMLAAGLEPLEPYPGRNGAPWLCCCQACGREVRPSYANVRSGASSGCAYCAGSNVDPEVARTTMVAAGLEPLVPYVAAIKPWPCRCTSCGDTVRPSYNNVMRGQGGCKRCGMAEYGKRRRLPEDDAIATMTAKGLTPLVPYPGAGRPWLCRCERCGHEVTPSHSSVRVGGSGCVWCVGQRLDESIILQAMQAQHLKPLEPYPGAMQMWLCRCTVCDHEVRPTYNSIQQGNGGCGWCAKVLVDPDEATKLMRSAGLEPIALYPGAGAPWLCRCQECEREVAPSYSNVRKRGRGCRYCAPIGFAYAAPGLVYLLHNPSYAVLKVGKTTQATIRNRVSDHLARGWVLVGTWATESGDAATIVEARVLAWWRQDLGAPAALLREDMPQGGWTETAALVHVDIDDTVERIQAEVDALLANADDETPAQR